jgi:ABC-type dipeptide/oligopeptide/nickel transport system permease subunit
MSLPAMEVLPGQVGDVPPEPEGPARKKIAGRSPTRIAIDRLRKDKIAVVCFVIVVLFILIAIFADQINSLFGVTTDTVRATDFVNSTTGLPLTGPPNEGFDPSHPFGVAPLNGRDNLAVWTKGCQTSLFLATMAATLSTIIGVVLGLLAGFLGGIFDTIISFTIDLFLTFPFLVGALALAPIINDRFATDPAKLATVSFWALVAILVLFGWMLVARLVRGEVLSLRERDFVKAARVIGVPTRRILVREMLPNLIAPIIVSFSLGLPAYVSAEAGLSFLGIGIIGRESWGRTIETASNWWQLYPQYLLAPVIGIAVLVVALNLLGDAIRDAFDPKTRR